MGTMVYKPGSMSKIEGVDVDFKIVDDVAAAKKDGWQSYADTFLKSEAKASGKPKKKATD